jgi:hypothetical protein
MRSLKDIALPAVGLGPAGKVSLSADSVPPNIGYGFQRYFVAEMKLEDRRPNPEARTLLALKPRDYGPELSGTSAQRGLNESLSFDSWLGLAKLTALFLLAAHPD